METLVITTKNKETAKRIAKVAKALDGKVESFGSIEALDDLLFGKMMDEAKDGEIMTDDEVRKMIEEIRK